MRSPQSGPYTDGRAQAAAGSKLVAKDYDLWAQTPAAALAVNDTRLWRFAQRLDQAWHQVRQHGLADGPGLAAARYTDLGDAAAEMASAYPAGLPSSALAMLLDLRAHAGKHATRLSATANAQASAAGGTREEQQMAAAVEQFQQPSGAYQGLPAGIAAVASSAHSGQPGSLRETAGTPEAKGRDARTGQQQSAKERDR